jgi:hypothetical protein
VQAGVCLRPAGAGFVADEKKAVSLFPSFYYLCGSKKKEILINNQIEYVKS